MEDNNVTRGGHFLFALIAMLVIAGIGFGIFTIITNAVNKQGTSLTTMATTLDESKFEQYNDQSIPGTQVVTLVKQWDGEEVQCVVNPTGGTATTVYAQNDNADTTREKVRAMSKKGDAHYVNPAGTFDVEVHRAANGVIDQVTFTQN